MTFYEAVLTYKQNRLSYKELQKHVDVDLLPGILRLLADNHYQPQQQLCQTLGDMVAGNVALELGWKEGSIDRLQDMLPEDIRQELYLLIYRAIDLWDQETEFELYFAPVLVMAIVDWYSRQ
jgi:hypothetical protein